MKKDNNIMNNYLKKISCLSITITFLILFTDVYSSDTLAVIDRKLITIDEFKLRYKEKLIQLGINDSYDFRMKFLMNLINDELLIADAISKKLDKSKEAKQELERIQNQELLNAFVTKHISKKINVTEDELKDLFYKLNTKIKVRHLYASTKEKADSLYKELKSGKSFEKLAKENFNDPLLKENGGLIGYISIDEMDPQFETAAFSLNIGDISKPVKTVYGYSIIKVEDIKINPLTTEYEFSRSKEKLKAFARKITFEKLAKKFSDSLRVKLKTEFNHQLISKYFETFKNYSLENILENSKVVSPSDLNKIVVKSTIEKWTVRKLIDEIKNVPEKQKKWIHTKENLEDFIAGLINRKYIIAQAKKEGLNKELSYKKNVEYNFETYLLSKIENEYKNKIIISDDSVKNYYERNINLFRTKPQIRLSSILLDDSTLVDTILINLQKGNSFESLSKKYSIQKITAERGGDLGYFTMDELNEYGEKIFTMKIGEWIGPLVSDSKYLFLMCTDRKESEIIPFEKVHVQILSQLKTFSWLNEKNKYANELKKKFTYKVYIDKLKEIKL